MRKPAFMLSTAIVIMLTLFSSPCLSAALEILTMTTYHDTEQTRIKERYSYYSDEWNYEWKQGPYKSWNYVGLPDVVTQYNRNELDGSYTHYLYAGDLTLSGVEQGTYENGNKVGTWTITPAKVNALQGRYEYEISEYGLESWLIYSKEEKKYLNGFPSYLKVCEYKNGLPVCVETYYHSEVSGKISSITRPESDGDFYRTDGFHLNGTRSITYLRDYLGIQGQRSEWADDGFLIRQTNWLDGKRHGQEIEYPGYEVANVKDKVIREFVNGIQQGDEKRYAEDGSMMYHHRYVNGFQEGEQRDYSNGKLFRKWFMKGGLDEGTSEFYYESGAIESRGNFVAGKLEGLAEQFHESGGISSRTTFHNDEIDGVFESFYEGGQIAARSYYKNGKANGKAQSWSEDGTPDSETTYVDGIEHGPAWHLGFGSFSDGGGSGLGIPARYDGQYGNGSTCGVWKLTDISTDDSYTYPPTYIDYGSCEGLYVDAPETPYDPAPPANTYEIRGRVTAAADGKPISGIQVYAGAGDPPAGCAELCASTDSTGYYRLLLSDAQSYPLQFIGSNFYKHTETADMTDKDYLTVNVSLKSPPPAQQGAPGVTKFTSRFGGVFLSSIPVTNTYTAAVNWNGGTPGTLRFTKNGTPSDSTGGPEGGSRSYNMGTDFISSLSTTANTLTVQAIGTDGKTSSVSTLRPIVIPTPSWSLKLGYFTAKEEKGVVTYGIETEWPEEPFSVQINQETLGDTMWNAWSLFPLIGGQKFGIPETQFGMGVFAGTDGVGGVSLGGTTGFEAAGSIIEGTIKGTGKVRYESGKGLSFAGADLDMGIKGTISREVGPVTLIPALSGATEWRFVGRFFKWFNNTAKIDGSISVGAELALGIVDANGELGFKPAEGTLSSGMELGIGSEIEGFKTRLSGGGTGKITWQIPANPGYYKESVFILNGKLDVNWKLFESSFEFSHPFPPGSSPQSAFTHGFRPVSRTYLNLGDYNLPVEGTKPSAHVPMSIRSPLEVTSSAVITNIYPYAGPVIAGHESGLAMAYVYNDPNDDPLQATEIYIVEWDGYGYSTPVAILNDTRAEFAPALAFDSDGTLISVWERVKDENFTETGDSQTDMENMAAQFEIVYAVRQPGSQWSTPVALTDNSYMDHEPMLARASDGSLMLAWRSNAGNLLSGDASFPTRIFTSEWNPSSKTFAAPVDTGIDFINATQFALAFNGDAAAMVYVYDPDGIPSTSSDQEIYQVSFDGAIWSAPSALTSDDVADFAPQVLYNQTGALEIAWRRGDNLVRYVGAGSFENIRAASGGLSFAGFNFLCDRNNRLVVLWQDQANDMVDLFYVAKDSSTGVWSNDMQLTSDSALEQDVDALFTNDGVLHLVFGREIEENGQTDLYHLTYQMGGDLALSGNDLSIEPVNPIPGESATLRCLVRNTGDAAYQDVSVGFYLGDPANGGTLIGTAGVTPVILAGAGTGEATLSWTVPVDLGSQKVYAIVDPDNLLSEADKENNNAWFQPLRPDLELLSTRIDDLGDGSVDVVAVVRNSGTATALAVETLFLAGERDLGITVIPRLDPGKTADISRRYYSGADFSGNEVIFEVVADPGNRIHESDETNNRSGALYIASPIATVVNSSLYFNAVEAGVESDPVYVTIRNDGGADLVISQIVLSDNTDFRVDLTSGSMPMGTLPAEIPSGELRTVAVILTPQDQTVPEITLTVISNDPRMPEISIPVKMETFVPVAGRLTAAPADMDFGEQTVGSGSPVMNMSITNTGTADLTITSVNLSSTDQFQIDSGSETYPVLLSPGASRVLSLQYNPGETGTHTAVLKISSSDTASPEMNIPLSGIGILSPVPEPQKIVLTPGEYYFGEVAAGADSDPLELFVANAGETTLRVSAIALTSGSPFNINYTAGYNPIGSLPMDIPPGENRTLTVTFSPTDELGYYTRLTINSDDPESPVSIIYLTGNDPFAGGPDISIAPASLDFEEVDLWKTGGPQVITISNNGGRDLNISEINSNDPAYVIDPDAGESPLGGVSGIIPAGEGRTIGVTFAPVEEMVYDGKLYIQSNDVDSPVLTVSMTGSGRDVPVPVIGIVPATLDFDTVFIGSNGYPAVLTITNSGDADLTIQAITLSDQTRFSININTGDSPLGMLPAILEPDTERTITVTFVPDNSNVFSAVLTVRSDDPATQNKIVSISGTGRYMPGDINGNGGIDLADAILTLRFMSGINLSGVNSETDINDDGRIGIEEILYILQVMAGIRPADPMP